MFDSLEHIPVPEGGFAAISKYNPHLWSADQLRAIFVARQQELADLTQSMHKVPLNTVCQHVLLVGARGMGKSTLMQRLALAVEDDVQLRKDWLPLRFPEEQYTVNTLGQFWLNVLGSMADALERQGSDTTQLDAAAERIAQLPAKEQAAACLQAINDSADERGQRLLMLVDNTDLLLHNIGKKTHWALRDELQSNQRLLWVGGSYQSLEANSSYHDAFLDFFQVIELKPLRIAEMEQALLALAHTFGGEPAAAAMQAQLNAHPERLPTLRQLSGGNPRTTVMLYELFSSSQTGNVRNDLEALLDNMTPLYKARLDTLADLPRKLMAHILEHWAPISLGNLAHISQVGKSSISPQLQRLELEGLIQKTKLQGTTRSGYQASERFFNIWYLMRLSPRRQRNKLSWLVEFMRLWFSPDELQNLARVRMSRNGSATQKSYDWEYDRAIADAMPQDESVRHQLRWSMLKQLKDKDSDLAQIFELDGEDKDFKSAADYLKRLSKLNSLLLQCPHAVTEVEKQTWANHVLGSFSLSLAEKEHCANNLSALQYEECVKVFEDEWKELRVQWGEQEAHVVRAMILSQDYFPDLPDSKLAYEQIRSCMEKSSDKVQSDAAYLHYEKHEDEWCLKTQELALTRLPEQADIAYRIAWLLNESLSRYSEAEMAYHNVIALDKKSAHPWNDLGNLLQNHLGRYAESEDAYRRAIALDEKLAYPWNGLGNLLKNHLSRYAESEEAYRRAIALNEKYVSPWNGLGNLLKDHLGRYAESEEAYRRAIALDEKYVSPWNGLGNLLQDHLARNEDAEEAYRRAVQLDPKKTYAKANLARLLVRQGKNSEADALYATLCKSASDEEQDVLLQANLVLGQQAQATKALLTLAKNARDNKTSAFFMLKEQVCECSELGLGERLALWMAQSDEAAFLQPFIQALYTIAGAKDKLMDLPLEIQQMADEVVTMASKRGVKSDKNASIHTSLSAKKS